MTELPDGWKVVPLGEVADTTLGKMLDGGKIRRLPNVPYLRNVNVQWGRIDTDDLLTMELADGDRERFAVQPGDLLVCEGGEIGRAAIWNGRTEYLAFQKALHRIRSRGNLDLSYVRYLFELYRDDGTLRRFATGSTIAHLPQQKLRALPVPLPPLDEQRRIVDILEDHLSQLDAAEHGLHLSLRRLASYEAVALSLCRDGNESPLGDVAEIQGGIQKQPKRAPKQNAYPFLRVANVTKNGLHLDEVHLVELFDGELDRLRLQPGDLLVVEGNGSASQIGRAALWDGSIKDCVHQNHLIRVRPKSGLSARYLEAVWNSPQNRRQLTDLASSSSGLHTLSVSKLKSLKLPVPALERQIELVAEVQNVRDRRRRLAAELDSTVARTGQLRRSLLVAAFAGRLTGRTTDMDMVEEMARV